MARTEFKSKELAEFIRFRDRALNPCFVGRKELIKGITDLSRDISNRAARGNRVEGYSSRPEPGLTQIIQGPRG